MTRHFQIAPLICGIAVAALTVQEASARNPTQQQLAQAPAGDLAISYLNAKVMLQTIEMAEAGIQIVTPEGTIDKSNAARFRSSYQAREKVYAEAITQRGYVTLAGSYRVRSADPACRRSYSTLLAGAAAPGPSTLTIKQTGPDLALSITLEEPHGDATRPERVTLDFIGATTEGVVAAVDPLNSDYFVEGRISGKAIEWRARAEVLNFWPKWAPGPTKADLAQCVVVFERVE